MGRLIVPRSCICLKSLHNFFWAPPTGPRRVDRRCCPCAEDCLCH